MNINTLSSYREIINYLLYNERECQEITTELINTKSRFFDSKESKAESAEVRKRKSIQYAYHFSEYKKCQAILTRTTTFKEKDFVEFLSSYYTAVYGIEYDACIDMKDKPGNKQAKSYDVIASKRDIDNILNNDSSKNGISLQNFLSLCQDPCVCLHSTPDITLLKGKTINPEIANVPEIEDVISRLVDLRFTDASLTDKKRLLSILKTKALEAGTPLKQHLATRQFQEKRQTVEPEAPVEPTNHANKPRVLINRRFNPFKNNQT